MTPTRASLIQPCRLPKSEFFSTLQVQITGAHLDSLPVSHVLRGTPYHLVHFCARERAGHFLVQALLAIHKNE